MEGLPVRRSYLVKFNSIQLLVFSDARRWHKQVVGNKFQAIPFEILFRTNGWRFFRLF